MDIRKVPPAAGAEWLLEAFRLLKKSPLGYGLLALIYAALMLAMTLGANAGPQVAGTLQVLFLLIGPLLMAGMVFAAHEVAEGRNASPSHLLASLRTGKAGRLLTTLIPQLAILALIFGLLVLIVGMDNFEKLSALVAKIQVEAQNGGQVDPQLFMDLPVGRLFLWMLLVIGISLFSLCLTFTVVPDMLFTDVRLVAAMKRSFTACVRNLPAMIVFMLLGVVVLFAVGIGAGILIGLAQLVFGNTAAVVGNALVNGFFICFIAGAMYFAWKQMLGDGGEAAASSEPSGVAM
jgi:uncharacterized membrane protein